MGTLTVCGFPQLSATFSVNLLSFPIIVYTSTLLAIGIWYHYPAPMGHLSHIEITWQCAPVEFQEARPDLNVPTGKFLEPHHGLFDEDVLLHIALLDGQLTA